MKKEKAGRRNFLKAAGIGGAGAAAVLFAARGVKQDATAVNEEKPEAKGYHLSEHINKYYKTTLI